ncbi:SGNH/GDSL hydrolase family protein [Aeoliella mucimassa]|uniref:GDSL-like Lipase/Acylhydrolase n=1 Tax=Aeoliella mucimassa TaxID=2527972 RepID=A0A518AVU1_9BACT|nr:SGNH/GDSL hydrolase family protein [Aeoliella mucimassa]QDU58840.1 GDSL-like Lipase/Acylhydrolase [Aeoliella mucimassa]
MIYANRALPRLLLFSLLFTLPVGQMWAAENVPWAKEMAEFAKQDTEQSPAEGGVVFVGSSSIRLWDLPKSLPDMEPAPLNRGFGGSQLSDSIRNVELLVLKHKPQTVIIYAGDNDLAGGKSAERVGDDFGKLVKLIHEALPETKIGYIAIKPSISRWRLAETIQDANARIAKQCEAEDWLTYIDVWNPMLDDQGKPREELFRNDGLHLNDKGYELWTSLVKPLLPEDEADAKSDQ